MWRSWIQRWQLGALEKAYRGAIALKEIEDKHFNGQPVHYLPQLGQTVYDYLQSRVERQLSVIDFNLNQFKLSGWVSRDSRDPQEAEILAKLSFIESVISRYRSLEETIPTTAEIAEDGVIVTDPLTLNTETLVTAENHSGKSRSNHFWERWRGTTSPDYEQQVVQQLRTQRKHEAIAIRWLLILILIPLFVQVITRNLIFEPLLDEYWDHFPNLVAVQQNPEISADFLHEYAAYKELLEIEELLGLSPPLDEATRTKKLEEKATELYEELGHRTLDGFKNIFADVLGLVTFVILAIIGRRQLVITRQVISRRFQGLSNPVKIFLIILVTDLFVGYHSPEGWDVLLKGVYQHFGIPENESVIKGFIATLPVLMDSWFKFWVFNYLTRTSPSAVAIYEKMNQ
ncbi:CemA family protein [Thermosynechococcus sp. FA-CM-4201]